jgi:hypothetical protein
VLKTLRLLQDRDYLLLVTVIQDDKPNSLAGRWSRTDWDFLVLFLFVTALFFNLAAVIPIFPLALLNLIFTPIFIPILTLAPTSLRILTILLILTLVIMKLLPRFLSPQPLHQLPVDLLLARSRPLLLILLGLEAF